MFQDYDCENLERVISIILFIFFIVLVIFLPIILMCIDRIWKIACYRIYSFWNWILFWVLVVFVLTCSFTASCYLKTLHFSCWMALHMLPFVWVIMIIECAFSRELTYLTNITEIQSAEMYIQNLRYY